MFHRLCRSCIRTCKQQDTAKIIRCPRYEKKVSESEFREMVDRLDTMEEKAERLHHRVHDLIESALKPRDEPPDTDGGPDEDANGDVDGV